MRLDRKFIGIEIEPKYFDIGCRRISEEMKRPSLFQAPKPKPVTQVSLFDSVPVASASPSNASANGMRE